jgi:hypothetical protein
MFHAQITPSQISHRRMRHVVGFKPHALRDISNASSGGQIEKGKKASYVYYYSSRVF